MDNQFYVVQIKQVIEKVRLSRHQLVFVIGEQSGNVIEQFFRETDIEPINLSLHLSQLLLELPVNRRGRKVGELFKQIMAAEGEVMVLQRIELLFLPELQVDPMRLFEDISRNKVLVIEWNGKYENGILTYARPDHPEYRWYHSLEASIILVH